ncbi:MAG: hypothetical protein KDK40_05000 [Chlamydiia bacterium]|nr:hypothetical protein [Chlamydiia bacterium]
MGRKKNETKRNQLKQIALMGLTSGLMIAPATTSAGWWFDSYQQDSNTNSRPVAESSMDQHGGNNGCGGKSSCGAKNGNAQPANGNGQPANGNGQPVKENGKADEASYWNGRSTGVGAQQNNKTWDARATREDFERQANERRLRSEATYNELKNSSELPSRRPQGFGAEQWEKSQTAPNFSEKDIVNALTPETKEQFQRLSVSGKQFAIQLANNAYRGATIDPETAVKIAAWKEGYTQTAPRRLR